MPINLSHIPEKISQWRGYPWLVAVLCMLVVTLGNGMINSGLTVFDESLLKEFGWTISQLKTRDSITFLGGSFGVLLAGWLVDRFGFKPFLLFGMSVLAATYFVYSYAQSLLQIYLLHLLFAVVISCAGNMTAIITAATWMPERRGLAVGMAIAGTSVGGMLIPPFANALNQQFGWRQSMQYEALLPLLLLLVLAVVIRNRTALQKAAEQVPVTGMRYAEVLRKPQFYQVACAGALTYYAILSLFSHLFLFMRSLDYAPTQASLALSTLAFAALTGKLLAGWLADRINPYRLLKWQMVLMLGGLLVITLLPGWIWAGLLLAGFGWGSLHTLYNFILLALFGLRDAGKINGSVSLCEAIGGGVGIFLTGWLHDQSGNYGFAFGVICAVLAAGVVLTAALRPVKVAAA